MTLAGIEPANFRLIAHHLKYGILRHFKMFFAPCITIIQHKPTTCTYSKLQSNLASRTPRITNNSVYEQMFRTQSVSDDVLCLELRTRMPSKRRQKQITLDNFLVRQRPSGSEAESSGAKRQKKEKRIPFQTITFHFLTTFHLRRQLSSIQVR